jgi:hypothetical protein
MHAAYLTGIGEDCEVGGMAKMVLNTINNQVCILQKPVFCCFEYSSTEVYLCKGAVGMNLLYRISICTVNWFTDLSLETNPVESRRGGHFR